MKLTLLIVFVALFTNGLCQNMNSYVDEVLANLIQVEGHNLDPFSLPNLSTGFSKKVVFVNVHGSANLNSGYVNGLRSIHRAGDFSLNHVGDEKYQLVGDIGVRQLYCQYRANAGFMGINVGATLKANVGFIRIRTTVAVDLASNSKQITNFDLNMSGMDIKVDGLGPLDWILNTVVGFARGRIQDLIQDKLRGPVRDALQNELNKFQIPM